MKELLVELLKHKPDSAENNDTFDLVEDALAYLEARDENECESNQHLVVMRYLFRDFIVKA